MVNRPMKPNAYSIGVSKVTDPLYMVAVQLKTLIAEGTPMKNVRNEKISAAYTDIPATNIWCAQTRKPRTAIATLDRATNWKPKMRLREKQAMSSLMMPIEGK